MLFPSISDVEQIQNYARGIGPEFLAEFTTKFHEPFVLGKRYFSFRVALNRYLNACVAAIENPQFDSIDLRRCLADEGDVGVWAKHIGWEIFPVLQAHSALLHWHQVAPESLR